jgi:beta-lactamase regulating signal transducer with metallopeptidase domain
MDMSLAQLIAAPSWFLSLLAVALRVSALLAVALAAVLLLRRRAAAVRHHIWAVALAASLMVPAVTWLLPPLELRVLPSSLPAQPEVRSAAFELPAPLALRAFRLETAPATWQSAFPLAVSDWLALVLIAGGGLFFFRLVADWIRVWVWAQRSRPIFDDRLGRFEVLARRVGVGQVRLVEAFDEVLPMTWGIWRPTVLLPSQSRTWSETRFEAVVLHELAHVRRHDALVDLLTSIACIVYWFHPLVWVAARQIRSLREYACDDEVVAHGVRPSRYAEEIVDLVMHWRRETQPASGVLSMARRSQLGSRLMALLDPRRGHLPLSPKKAFGVGLVALVLLFSLTGVRLMSRYSEERFEFTTRVSDQSCSPCSVAVHSPAHAHASESRRAIVALLERLRGDDRALASALRNLAATTSLTDEASRQTFIAATDAIAHVGLKASALVALLEEAPTSEATAAAVLERASALSDDEARAELLAMLTSIHESHWVRGRLADAYLDVAAELSSEGLLAGALRNLLHPRPLELHTVGRSLDLLSRVADADARFEVLTEVIDHQSLGPSLERQFVKASGGATFEALSRSIAERRAVACAKRPQASGGPRGCEVRESSACRRTEATSWCR